MGDHRERFVDLDTPMSHAPARVEKVRTWLRTAGWTAEGDPTEPDWLASEGVTERGGSSLGADASVTIHTGDVWIAGGGTTGPRCPKCSATFDEEASWRAIEQWVAGTEPLVTCDCGWTAPIGDWDLEESVAVGSLAITIWPPVGGVDVYRFGDALRAGVGGRWAWVHFHL